MKRVLLSRVIALFSLWGFAALAFADNAPSFPNSTQSATDMSVKYLGQIFGSVPGVLTGSGSGLMGQLFLVFNQGIMVVAFVYLMFNIAQIMMQYGMSPQGQTRINAAMTVFRVAIGLALLVPMSTTGYSAIQDVMMKVVVEGTKLADLTWNQALDYLQNGGVLYSPAGGSNQLTDISELSKYNYIQQAQLGQTHPRNSLANTLFKDEVCMFVSNHYNQKNKSTDPVAAQGAKGTYSMVPVQPTMSADGTSLAAGTGAVYFPGYGDKPLLGDADPTTGYAGHQSCGSISVDGATLKASDATQMQYQQAFAAIYQMALDMQPLAKAQAKRVSTGNVSAGLSATAGGKWLSQSILQYVNLMKPVAAHQASTSQTQKGKFFTLAKDEGWFNAGGFYWDLSRWNDALASSGTPVALVPLLPAITYPSKISDLITSADNTLGGNGITDIWGNGYQQIQNSISANASNDPMSGSSHDIGGKANWVFPHSVTFDTGGIDFASIMQNALRGVVNQVETSLDPSNPTSYDPLVMVQQLGVHCLSAAGDIWVKTIGWSVSLSAVMGVCDAASPGPTIMKAMMSWLMPIWTMVATSLFAAGFMLAFYAPLYPYLLFLFGVIGWLLSVVEAMIAAPLVCFGMTHPEGHDFMGRADQALMLALGVFLRPALMVIGFLAGLLMTYVGYTFVNTVLGRVFVSAFGDSTVADPQSQYTPMGGAWAVIAGGPHARGQNSHFTGHDFSDFLLVPLLLVAYGMIVIEVVNQCFSAIHVVPDQVLRWIGGPVQQDTTEQRAGAVKGAMSSASQQAGQLGSTGVKAASEGMGGMAQTGTSLLKAGGQAGLKKLNSKGDDGGGKGGEGAEGAEGGEAAGSVAA
ncbi:MAG: DotA/TraY family protein [Coxiellaceae bacterium]|nr:DotA/TraY family protein [Coxiellaceae bacterium]